MFISCLLEERGGHEERVFVPFYRALWFYAKIV